MKGNEAVAEAAIRAGCRHFFGYPITPQTEIAAYMAKRMPRLQGTYVQAESEIAAINMVYGAAAAGARAMTSSSSPGISLKSEGISYLAASDLPCVIVNVQRGSPGLGGIQPSQADYWQATRAPGHGDLRILVFAPCSVQEMVDMTCEAFALADAYRMPAMLLADGMLGQMMEPVVFPETLPPPPDKFSWAACGHGGKRAHNIINSLILQPEDLETLVKNRFARYEAIARAHAKSESYRTDDAEFVVVAFGATARIARSAVDLARAQGVRAGLLRPQTLWPYPSDAVRALSDTARAFLCVEMNMGQMVDDVRLATSRPVRFFGHTGGVVPTPQEILDELTALAGGAQR